MGYVDKKEWFRFVVLPAPIHTIQMCWPGKYGSFFPALKCGWLLTIVAYQCHLHWQYIQVHQNLLLHGSWQPGCKFHLVVFPVLFLSGWCCLSCHHSAAGSVHFFRADPGTSDQYVVYLLKMIVF